jgi:hypothetical protein
LARPFARLAHAFSRRDGPKIAAGHAALELFVTDIPAKISDAASESSL